MQFVNLPWSRYIITNLALYFPGLDGVVVSALITTYTYTTSEQIPLIQHFINDDDDYLGYMLLEYSWPDWPPFSLSLISCN